MPNPEPQTIHYAPFNETLGSTGAGKAINLTKLGVENTLHSIIGEDVYGENIIKKLRAEGVRFIYDIDPKGTERHVNLMDEQGNRISIFVTQSSSNLGLDMVKLETEIQQCDIVVLNIIGYTKQLILLIKKYNKEVWTDLHDYNIGNPYHEAYIELANYIFVSSDNLPEYKVVMKRWIGAGKKLVVCTHGKKGATALLSDGSWIETPIIDTYAFKDANGAGDSFFSGFLYGYLKGREVEQCMQLGTLCAGLCITSSELAFEELSEELLEKAYEAYRNQS